MKWLTRLLPARVRKALSVPSGRWWTIYETTTGAWQMDIEATPEQVTAYWAVFSCVTVIASDFAKCPPVVMQQAGDIWEPTLQRRPLLRKPNSFQTGYEFFFSWAISKLLHGNTYVLKVRNRERFVERMYVLDPLKVRPLVSDSGAVFYELANDNLAGLGSEVVVPASEIIHDKMYTLYHPLVGVSPLHACAKAATQGLAIQNNSTKFFKNMSRPSGILTAPGKVSDETAKRLKTAWEENFSAENIGRIAVVGDDLKYSSFAVPAEDAQLIEQLKMTAEMVCACFHFPGYKIGVGQAPTVNNTATLNQQYYDQCLQTMFEPAEARLDEGLELADGYELWFDLENLLRMDPEARYKAHNEAIKGGWFKPNEARGKENLKPVAGGDTPYLQQQNYSLAALASRDARDMQGGGNVQSSALAAGQITSLQGILTLVASGKMPVESARATIAAAFPALTPEQIDAMLAPMEDLPTPEPPADDAADQAAEQLAAELAQILPSQPLTVKEARWIN